jgi:MFS family permease
MIKIYVSSFFRYFILFLPIIVPYFTSLGLTHQEVMTLQSVSAATFFLTEVPTGYFSDRFKRKWAMICAALIRIVSVLSLMRAQNFHDLVVFEILFALSLCFDSGTDTAILYDTSEELKSTSGEPELGSSGLLSNRVFYLQIGEAVSAVLGGMLATYSLKYTIYGSLGVALIQLFIALSVVEPARTQKGNQKDQKQGSGVFGVLGCFKNNALMSCGVLLVFINLLTFIGTWTYQMNWTHSGVDLKYFGYLWAGYNVAIALAARLAPKLEEYMGSRWLIILTGSLPAIGFLGMCYSDAIFAVAAGFALQFCRGFQGVTIHRIFNDQLPSGIRATANSFISLAIRGVFALTAPFVGYLVDQKGIKFSYFCLGISSFLAFGLIFYFVLNRRLFDKDGQLALSS